MLIGAIIVVSGFLFYRLLMPSERGKFAASLFVGVGLAFMFVFYTVFGFF